MKEMVIMYLAVSFIVFVTTIRAWTKEANYLASFPIGDIGYYVFPSKNYNKFTMRHYIFAPSILFIKLFRAIKNML